MRETGEQSPLLEFAVLREQSQIASADRELQQRGLLDPPPEVSLRQRIARRLLHRPDPALVLKTWDVQRSLEAFVAAARPG